MDTLRDIQHASRAARTRAELEAVIVAVCDGIQTRTEDNPACLDSWVREAGRSVICQLQHQQITLPLLARLVEAALSRGCDCAAVTLSSYCDTLPDYEDGKLLQWMSDIPCGKENVEWAAHVRRVKSIFEDDEE